MSDRLKMPPARDCGFYQRRKHDKWCAVEPPTPALEAPVADTHAHIHMLPEPAWELVRCAANGVAFACEVCDPSEDGKDVPGDVRRWVSEAGGLLGGGPLDCGGSSDEADYPDSRAVALGPGLGGGLHALDGLGVQGASGPRCRLPELRIAAGVHPHNARLYGETVEARLRKWLEAPEAVVLGEIGLDYHYDISPRDAQRQVFRRQIRLAHELGMPIALHLRGGEQEDGAPSNAHAEAFAILQEEGFPERGTILHCCSLPPDELVPWIEAGCYVAYGGAVTFKNADAARDGARIVPEDRLLLETDSPYMAPEPMRGAACTPAHVVFTAARLAEVRECEPGPKREHFLRQLCENARRFFAV